MLKLTIDENNNVVKVDVVTHKEVYVDMKFTDYPVVCKGTGEIKPFKESTQGKARIQELTKKKELTRAEFYELFSYTEVTPTQPISEDLEEKQEDIVGANEFLSAGKYLVNVTTKGKKKIAKVHTIEGNTDTTLLEYDEERGDKFFDTLEEAQNYADSFNL